jgi:hypothetical protein
VLRCIVELILGPQTLDPGPLIPVPQMAGSFFGI